MTKKKLLLIALYPYLGGLMYFLLQYLYTNTLPVTMNNGLVYFIEQLNVIMKFALGAITIYWLYLIFHHDSKLVRRILLINIICFIGVIVIYTFAAYYNFTMFYSQFTYNGPTGNALVLFKISQTIVGFVYNTEFLVLMGCNAAIYYYLVKKKKPQDIAPIPFSKESKPDQSDRVDELPLIPNEDIQIITATKQSTTTIVSPPVTRKEQKVENVLQDDETWKPKS